VCAATVDEGLRKVETGVGQVYQKIEEVWLVIRRHLVRVDGSPCPECGIRAIHELRGVGVPDGPINAEEMAKRLCVDGADIIGPIPPNILLPDEPSGLPGSYQPLADIHSTEGD
jgi:hypothetical protein